MRLIKHKQLLSEIYDTNRKGLYEDDSLMFLQDAGLAGHVMMQIFGKNSKNNDSKSEFSDHTSEK